MSLWTSIGTAISNGWNHVKSWIAPEVAGGQALASELGDEIDRIGPQLIFDTVSAAIATAASGGNLATGALITAVANSAIQTLKAQGKQQVTAAVFGASAAALLKMNATANAQGITTQS